MFTVLIIDDYFGDEIGALLENQDFFPIVYTSGLKAIEEINNGLEYDIAFVDLSLLNKESNPMYCIDGMEIIKLLKKKNPDKPVYVLSSYFGWRPNYCNGIANKHCKDDLVAIIKNNTKAEIKI